MTISKLALIFSILFAALGIAEAATQTTTLTISGQNNVVISGLTISTTSGDCIDIVNSTNVTIQASQIGPCGTNNSTANSRGIFISNSSANVYDSYIHVENQSSSCSDSHDGIYIFGNGPVNIRGNVVAYNETHVRGSGASNVTVDGNFFLNARGSTACGDADNLQGHGVQFWDGGSSETISNNYYLDRAGTPYLYDPAQSDGLSCGDVSGCVFKDNWIQFDPSHTNTNACGIIADNNASSTQIIGNVVLQTYNCGIAGDYGTGTIEGNKVILTAPTTASAQGIELYGVYGNCGPWTVSNNTAYSIQSSGAAGGFWASSNCPYSGSGNVWGSAAYAALNPIVSTNPPPLIPPVPVTCVATSPYSTQTSAPPCVAVASPPPPPAPTPAPTPSPIAAHSYTYQCNGSVGELEARIDGTSAWTETDGGAGTTTPIVNGDIVEIDGTTHNASCVGDIFINTDGVAFKNHSGTDSLEAADQIDGVFEVAGAHVTIDGIALTCSACSTATANATNGSTFTENGALLLHDGAMVWLQNASITGGLTSGAFITGNSALSVISTTIAGNGLSGSNAPSASGIFAENASSVRLGNPDGSGGVVIGGNGKSGGGCPGFGILLTERSSLTSFAATIGGAGTASDDGSQNTCGQILLENGSSARLEGNTITESTASLPAVQLQAGSSIITTNNARPTSTTISSGDNGAMLLGAASSAVLNTSAISSTGTSVPTIAATASSTVSLGGGNAISNTTTGGIVFQMDHASSLIQVPAHQFGFIDAADAVTGSAFIQVQSSADLGIGLISAAPSLTWSVPAGDCVLVQQNSSFRLSGGVAISGAAPSTCVMTGATSTTVVIQQESNGFFNIGRGGGVAISGGGSVSCVYASFPNAHVNGKGNISPSGAQPVIIGGSMQASTTTSSGCLEP